MCFQSSIKISGFALDCVKLPSVTRLQLAWDSDNLTVIRVFTLHWNDSTGVQCCLRTNCGISNEFLDWNTAPRFDLIYLCACLTVGAAQSTLAKLISAQKHQNCSWSAHLNYANLITVIRTRTCKVSVRKCSSTLFWSVRFAIAGRRSLRSKLTDETRLTQTRSEFHRVNNLCHSVKLKA